MTDLADKLAGLAEKDLAAFDLCECGDYRRDHKDGTGPCAFNRPGFDGCHAYEDCAAFRPALRNQENPQ